MTEENLGVEQEQTAVVEPDDETEQSDEAAKLKEAVEVETEDVGTLRKKLTVTIPREIIDERLNGQYSELKKDAVIPGFRKGHAPLKLIEKRFGQDVGDELVSKLVSSGFLAAVDKIELKTLGDPLLWIDDSKGDGEKLMPIDKALAFIEMPTTGPLTFSCEVELRPEFELPELEGIPVEKPKVGITDEDVENEIKRYLSFRAQFVPVDGAIEADDFIVADVTMKIDGEVVKEEKNVPLAARGQMIEGTLVEDLGDALIGQKAGALVTVEATIGDDDPQLDRRGKQASFELTIQDVKRMQLPPLDNELVTAMGFDDENEMRSQIRASLESRLDTVIQRGLRGQIGKYLIENTTMDVPPGLSQRQTERVVMRGKVDLYQQGLPEAEIDKKTDELRARAGEDVVKELKLFFVMEKIAEKMEVEVLEDELNGAIGMIARQQGKRFDRVRDELSKGEGLLSLYLRLRDDKILDDLLKKAVVTEVEGPIKGAEKAKSPEKKPRKKAEARDEEKSADEPVAKKTSKKSPKKKEAD